ncbi:MAG TPA: thioredoxin domain-containing protein [Bdellovibrionota bacterium]|nr:thioredoxin domain-containing protein [Bdellovibrionota bacterium]
MRKVPLRLSLISILSLMGFGFAVSLTQHFYGLRNGTAGFKSYCNLGGSINCDVVSLSTYSELIAGLPLSSFAAGWFIALFLITLVARNPFWRRDALRIVWGMTAFSVAWGLAYFALMAAVIKAYCLSCMAIDVISITAFVLATSLKPEGFAVHKPDVSKWKRLFGVIATCMIVAVLGLRAFEAEKMSRATTEALINAVFENPPVSVSVSDDLPSFGPKDAPITIVEFSDFQCPFCRLAAMTLNTVVSRYPDKIRVVFRNFPLYSACNGVSAADIHPFACEAAHAVVCANQQNKFQDLYEVMFEKQADLKTGRTAEWAGLVGVDTSKFKDCMETPATQLAVAKDTVDGGSLGVRSTPTFFVNGYKVEGAFPYDIWVEVIERLLKNEARR